MTAICAEKVAEFLRMLQLFKGNEGSDSEVHGNICAYKFAINTFLSCVIAVGENFNLKEAFTQELCLMSST